MISVCYLIVCIKLYYYFDLVETSSHKKSWDVWRDKEDLHLKSITVENQDEILAKMISPFWNLPYNQELIQKQNHCSAVLKMMEDCIDSLKNPMTCKLLPIVPSPIIRAYRNRDLFSIKSGVDGNIKTVGLLVQNISLGLQYAIRPTKIRIIKESHKKVAQVYEDFIRISPLLPELYGVGHWRHLLVRSNQAGHIMASVTVQPRNYTRNIIYKEQQRLKMYFYAHLPRITLYHQQCPHSRYSRCISEIAPYVLQYGQPYLMDTIKGYKFKISPDSFFQVNNLAAEAFYDTVIKTAKLTPNTTVLDVFSGAGVFSIMVSKFVKEAIGIETNWDALKNAEFNAKTNNIHNVNFAMGNPGKILYGVLRRLRGLADLLVMVHPGSPKGGFDVVLKIHRATEITRVVYISRKPDRRVAMRVIIALCSNKTSSSPPFTLTKAIPVDLLPRTADIDLMYMLKRPPFRK